MSEETKQLAAESNTAILVTSMRQLSVRIAGVETQLLLLAIEIENFHTQNEQISTALEFLRSEITAIKQTITSLVK
jgi:hypothetical protein